MPTKEQMENASSAWAEIGKELEIRVIAPFEIASGQDLIRCIAFLPNFGGPRGMVMGAIDPDSPSITDQRISKYAKENGLYCSFVGLGTYGTRSKSSFVEALEDWGYYGPTDDCPPWFNGYKHFSDPQ
jgi:hypothetical protein